MKIEHNKGETDPHPPPRPQSHPVPEETTEETSTRVKNVLHNQQEKIIDPVSPKTLSSFFEKHEPLERLSDGKEIHIIGDLDTFRDAEGKTFLKNEIGRLREKTFRAVGEGTGRSLDIDTYDDWYDHIIIWDPKSTNIIGAYRVGIGPHILQSKGLEGLYSTTLFDFSKKFQDDFIARGAELGRSFVIEEHQGLKALDHLFRGIGKYMAEKIQDFPELRYMFGPVSMSAQIDPAYREMIMYYFSHYYDGESLPCFSEDCHTVQAKNPPAIRQENLQWFENIFEGNDSEKDWTTLRKEFKKRNEPLPILFNSYTQLVHNGHAGMVAFNKDPDFSDCYDGLIILDLKGLRKRYEKRYGIDLKSSVQA